jgi:hypothetical protein
MSEREILFRISNIVNGFLTFAQAVERIGLLLDRAAGGKALMIETTKRSIGCTGARKVDRLTRPTVPLAVYRGLPPGGRDIGERDFVLRL